MNQNNPETCALTARCPMHDAALLRALADMRRACGGGDVPAKLVRKTAHQLKLSTVEFAEAAARLNHPFATSHAR